MSHTPGPWAIERNHNGRIFGVSGANPEHDLDMVCDMPFQAKNTEANAILISEAPSLLQRLEALVGLVDHDHEANDPTTDLYVELKLAKAAIASATSTESNGVQNEA